MPADVVGKYLVQNEPTILDAATQWVAAYGITTALTMLNASGGGQHGVQIDYITTIGSGNSRVYSKWGSEPYVLSLPNGGPASWAGGEYYAKP